MKVCIAGGNGFIGRSLTDFFIDRKFEIEKIERKDLEENTVALKIRDCDAVINLIGESVRGIWTKRKRDRIYNSRILSTRKIVEAINISENRVNVFMGVSAIGIYDNIHSHEEGSSNLSSNFLSYVIRDWEVETRKIKNEKIRIVIMRLGVVFGKGGGILDGISRAFSYGFGFIINSKRNLPFIHLDDLLLIFELILKNDSLEGVFNIVSPEAVNICDFYLLFAKLKGVRVRIFVNPYLVKILLGESATLLIDGQYVIPKKLINAGYIFKYGKIEDALIALNKRERKYVLQKESLIALFLASVKGIWKMVRKW